MSKKLFVPYELAINLKEKGFPNSTGSCLAAWEDNPKGRWLHFGAHPIGLLQAPLYQQAVDWLRDKHKIIIVVDFTVDNDILDFNVKVSEPNTWNVQDIFVAHNFKDYHKALEKGIAEGLKLIP